MATIVNPYVSGVGQNNLIPIVQKNGSLASPLATMVGPGAGTGFFTLPTSIILPAGIIGPQSRIRVQALSLKTGGNQTANFDVYLGTANSSADSRVLRIAFAITTGHYIYLDGAFGFGTSTTSGFSFGKQTINNSGTDGQVSDFNTNINTAATMYMNLGINNSLATDSFSLINYRVWIEN